MLEYFDSITVLILIIVFIISWLVTQRIDGFKFFTRRGLSGPKPHFIFGNVRQIFRSKDPLKLLKEWQKSYGKVFGYFEGNRPAYMISDPDLVKEITVKEFGKFLDRPMFVDIGEPFNRTILDANGDVWKRIRSTLTPAFTGNKLKQMSGIMDESLRIFSSVIKEKADNKEEFDIHKCLRSLTLQMVAESVFALQVDCQRNPENEFYTIVNKHLNSFAHSPLIEYTFIFPWFITIIAKLSFKLGTGEMMKRIQYLLDVLKKLIKERTSNPQKERIDMMQLLIDAADESISDHISEKSEFHWDGKKGLSHSEIEANGFVFLVAGYDTTYNAATFVIHQLTLYPEIQKMVHEEIDRNIHTEIPTYDDVKKLTYLDQVISETLRLFPLVNIFLSRKCIEDCTISGYQFFKGMSVHIQPYLLHYNEEYWPDNETFDPERFSPENKRNIRPMTYLPFGSGLRNCIGQRLALMEMKLMLVTLLKDYRLLKGTSFETKLKLDGHIVVLRPKDGVQIMLAPRNSQKVTH